MIFKSLIFLVISVANFILDFLPGVSQDVLDQISSSIIPFKSAMVSANWLFPVNEAMGFLATVLLIEALLFTWSVVRWIGSHLTLGIIK